MCVAIAWTTCSDSSVLKYDRIVIIPTQLLLHVQVENWIYFICLHGDEHGFKANISMNEEMVVSCWFGFIQIMFCAYYLDKYFFWK